MKKIRVLFVDDNSMVREGIAYLIAKEPEFVLLAKVEEEEECLRILSELKPDIIILNVSMKKINSFALLKKVNQVESCSAKILLLIELEQIGSLKQSSLIGADGLVLKESSFSELKQAILSLANGEVILREKMESMMTDQIDTFKNLTKRELDVLKYLTTGMYNKEIALKLGISERTVKNHIFNIFKKIGVSDRTQAAVYSIKNHLVDIF